MTSDGDSSQPIRVLVADDHPRVRAALLALIDGQRDMTVVDVAADADEAVLLTTDTHPDIVVMDVRMPGGGAAATRRIAALDNGAAVVAFSADDAASARERMRRAGAVAFVSKTGRADRLLATIRRHHASP